MKKTVFFLIFMMILLGCKIDYYDEYSSGGCYFSFYDDGIVFAGIEKEIRQDKFLIPNHIYGLPVTGIGNSKPFSDVFDFSLTNLNYVKEIEIPSTVDIIFRDSFRYYDELESIKINSAKEIESYAFGECSNLTQVILPENLTTLGDEVFMYCEKLTDIVLPQSINKIGKRIFNWCNSLKTIKIFASEPPSLSSLWSNDFSFDYGDAQPNAFSGIYVPAESVELYKNASGWKDYADKIFSIEELNIPTYIVFFESNGGTEIENCTVKANKEITVEPIPEKDGAIFAGWYYDKEFTQKVTFPFSPKSNVTLYAEFVSPPESTSFTYSTTSSSITVNITPSSAKYFDCYHIVVRKHYGSLTSRAVLPPVVLADEKINSLNYKINGLDNKYYHSVSLYVIDKFNQSSEVSSKSFNL